MLTYINFIFLGIAFKFIIYPLFPIFSITLLAILYFFIFRIPLKIRKIIAWIIIVPSTVVFIMGVIYGSYYLLFATALFPFNLFSLSFLLFGILILKENKTALRTIILLLILLFPILLAIRTGILNYNP
jgi:hypothetical protein